MNLLADPSVRVSSKGVERLAQPWASPMITIKLGFLDSSATSVVTTRRMQSGVSFFMQYLGKHQGADKVSKKLGRAKILKKTTRPFGIFTLRGIRILSPELTGWPFFSVEVATLTGFEPVLLP